MLGYNPHLSEVTGTPLRQTRHRPVLLRLPAPSRLRASGLLVLALLAGPLLAQNTSRDAEKKLQQLRGELRNVSQERRQLEGQRDQAQQQLRAADQKVARSGRAVAEADAAVRREQQALAELQQRKATLQGGLAQQRRQLAALLRGAYQLGNHAPLKLLLSQDTVADGNRQLAYHRYLQRERAAAITALTADLTALESTEQQITARSRELEQAREQQRRDAATLAQDRRQRATVVAELDQRYQDRSDREKALGKDAQSLERLLANLRAAAARAEAERRAAARRAAAAQSRQAANGATAPRDAARAAPGKTPPRVVANAPAPRVGGLGWPLSGNLLARYGGRLPDGRNSSGVLIGAPAGSTVNAVADGTVVFSDWMTGYGMILIVDHGNGYMSLYAHNDALLRDAGARVRRGEAVAKVGNSGGQGVTALYFELRRNGQPVDPSTWLQRQ
ncbi:peptidoglycan DD-metalloendopeptidase family protein [Stenotrophomonas sp.]|uniref:murein hydrolase activator EnvC family protein n=1 Tax=Stenotrophomonas sp. TaxID=69392 RepID=UPI0028A5B99F|nr:peptidoglycan DD-metalloendopeptidase family protein [Stenotrophomonas sp.]